LASGHQYGNALLRVRHQEEEDWFSAVYYYIFKNFTESSID